MLRPKFLTRGDGNLPDRHFIELITILVSGRLPVVIFALTILTVAFVALPGPHRGVNIALAAGILILLATRFQFIRVFDAELRATKLGRDRAAIWDRRYSRLMICYALLLGLFNLGLASSGDAATRTLIVAEIFGFCAGQVSRGPSRPRLSGLVILTAAVPTALGMLIAGLTNSHARLAQVYILLAIFIVVYAVSSLESIAAAYRHIVEQLDQRRRLAGLVREDPLTGLPNRVMFAETLDAAIRKTFDDDTMVALHMIDLDGFKPVNDCYGHPAGDELLVAVGRRIVKLIRNGDTAVRLGGDEFAVIQTGITNADEANLLARRITRKLSEAFAIAGHEVVIGACAGIAICPDHATDADALIEAADTALYRAKRAGRGLVATCVSDPHQASAAA